MLSVFSHPAASGPASPVKPAGAVTPGISLRALLIAELADLYHAKQQLLKARPMMAKAATNVVLKAGLADHVKHTQRQMTRLVQAFGLLGIPAKGRPCQAMKGLIEETAAAIALDGPAAVRDAALIGAAQRVEHYELAGYGTARAFASALGERQVAELLQETLYEEGDANKELTLISAVVNAGALALGGDSPDAARRG
jgi:ferritin-like metal-binding protein YciE